MPDEKRVDPDLFAIIGALTSLVGLLEKVFPGRIRVERRQSKVDKLLDKFKSHLEEARTALRAIQSVVATAEIPPGAIAFEIRETEV